MLRQNEMRHNHYGYAAMPVNEPTALLLELVSLFCRQFPPLQCPKKPLGTEIAKDPVPREGGPVGGGDGGNYFPSELARTPPLQGPPGK